MVKGQSGEGGEIAGLAGTQRGRERTIMLSGAMRIHLTPRPVKIQIQWHQYAPVERPCSLNPWHQTLDRL